MSMETAYAQALWNLIARGKTPKRAVLAMKESLEARGRSELMPKIARAFGRIAERELRKESLVLSVASRKDARAIPRKFTSLFTKAGIDTKSMATRIDATLVGGWRLEGREQLIDASYKKYLLEMYNRVTSH